MSPPHQSAQAEGWMGGWALPSSVLLQLVPKGDLGEWDSLPRAPHAEAHARSTLRITVTQAAPPGPSPGRSDKGSDSFWTHPPTIPIPSPAHKQAQWLGSGVVLHQPPRPRVQGWGPVHAYSQTSVQMAPRCRGGAAAGLRMSSPTCLLVYFWGLVR